MTEIINYSDNKLLVKLIFQCKNGGKKLFSASNITIYLFSIILNKISL